MGRAGFPGAPQAESVRTGAAKFFGKVSSMAESPEVMNIKQASQYLGVSPDTLYKYVAEEKIPAFKLGNRWRFKKTILDAWMEQKSATGQEYGRPPQKTPRARLAKRALSTGSGS